MHKIPKPKPTAGERKDREFEFVACALPALIQICRVECTPEGMVNATRMLRQVYRDAFK